jgi:radical SAM superfamily enzyme YgiQ (UPF0313 family)
MICSRGCPFRCSYCINSGRSIGIRYRSPESIVNEIRFLKNAYNIDDFSFGDEIFTVNRRKAIEICEAIAAENVTWVTSCRADGIDETLLRMMKNAGCRMVLIGFESGSKKILRSMNKHSSPEDYHEAVKILRKSGVKFYGNFMIGMPEETRETVEETEKFCVENKLIFGGSYVTPFPGSQLYDDVKYMIADEKKYLFSLAKMNFSKRPVVNLTRMSTNELVKLRSRLVIKSITEIVLDEFRFLPRLVVEGLCWMYLKFFDVKNPAVAKCLRPISKTIYARLFEKGSAALADRDL